MVSFPSNGLKHFDVFVDALDPHVIHLSLNLPIVSMLLFQFWCAIVTFKVRTVYVSFYILYILSPNASVSSILSLAKVHLKYYNDKCKSAL